jgi:hypothetical protein
MMRKLTAIWLATLITVAGATAVFVRAQSQTPLFAQIPADAPILSGSDIGFRVEGNKDGHAVGTLMVRINGKWVTAAFGPSTTRLTLR